MKITLLALTLMIVASATAHSLDDSPLTLDAPSLLRGNASHPSLLTSSTNDPMALARRAPGDNPKNAQVWVGIGSLSYEHFAGDRAGDEFGFTPTGYLGYQRNFYPGGRLTNNFGYSLGVGFAALGAAVFYHQGAGRGVDFRAGIAADLVYYNSFSYFGDDSHFIVLPFVAWGIKI